MTQVPQSKHPAKMSGLILLPRILDPRGSLCVAECGKQVPFTINRCFWTFDVPGKHVRGEHAHKECHQFLICVHGQCILATDDGYHREEFLLDKPEMGIYVPPMVWATEREFSEDAILLVLASHPYEAADYIRDYTEFLKLAGVQR